MFFPTAQNRFWTQFWCLLVLCHFLFHLLHTGKTFSFEGCFVFLFFIWVNKNSHSGWDQVNREGGGTGVMPLLVRNCWTLSEVWAGVLINHPSWNGQMCWKSLQKKKNSLKPKADFHNNASWYTDSDGFLEHSRSGWGSLYYKGPTFQKIILFLEGTPFIWLKDWDFGPLIISLTWIGGLETEFNHVAIIQSILPQ